MLFVFLTIIYLSQTFSLPVSLDNRVLLLPTNCFFKTQRFDPETRAFFGYNYVQAFYTDRIKPLLSMLLFVNSSRNVVFLKNILLDD